MYKMYFCDLLHNLFISSVYFTFFFKCYGEQILEIIIQPNQNVNTTSNEVKH
jgi:hypothetical protein